jgi:hypothetical protein
LGARHWGRTPEPPRRARRSHRSLMFKGYPGLRNLRVTPRSLYESFLSYVGVTSLLLPWG